MPSHYRYLCRECGEIEVRYSNAARCRKCYGPVVRLADNSLWGGLQPILGEQLLDWLVALTGRAAEDLTAVTEISERAIKELRLPEKWHKQASDYVAGFLAGYLAAEKADQAN